MGTSDLRPLAAHVVSKSVDALVAGIYFSSSTSTPLVRMENKNLYHRIFRLEKAAALSHGTNESQVLRRICQPHCGNFFPVERNSVSPATGRFGWIGAFDIDYLSQNYVVTVHIFHLRLG